MRAAQRIHAEKNSLHVFEVCDFYHDGVAACLSEHRVNLARKYSPLTRVTVPSGHEKIHAMNGDDAKCGPRRIVRFYNSPLNAHPFLSSSILQPHEQRLRCDMFRFPPRPVIARRFIDMNEGNVRGLAT